MKLGEILKKQPKLWISNAARNLIRLFSNAMTLSYSRDLPKTFEDFPASKTGQGWVKAIREIIISTRELQQDAVNQMKKFVEQFVLDRYHDTDISRLEETRRRDEWLLIMTRFWRNITVLRLHWKPRQLIRHMVIEEDEYEFSLKHNPLLKNHALYVIV